MSDIKIAATTTTTKSLQSCPTLCNPIDGSPPGSPIPGILQARTAERSAVKCMGFPLYATCCFSLAAFNILSLCLVFVSLISMCLGVFLLGFILYVTYCFSLAAFNILCV